MEMRYVTQYRTTRDRMEALARGLDTARAETAVAACPGWSVRDVYAHVVAVIGDAVAGTLTGVPTDEQTAAQVAARADLSLAEICDEWRSYDDRLDDLLSLLEPLDAAPVLIDQWTHEQDVAAALGIVSGRDAGFTRWAASKVGPQFMVAAHRAGLASVELRVDGLEPMRSERGADAPTPQVALDVGAHEFVRGALGRRSRAQIGAWAWSGTHDPTPYVDALLVFGVAEDDLVEP